MTYPIRPVSESEWPAFTRVLAESFNSTLPPAKNERYKANTEFDRTLAAHDGDLVVGVTGIHSFSMTVPGGPIPVAGVTAVSVLPSHRRRGVLSSLMRRQLADIHERGETVAALYASESPIYGRFGYGRAADELSFHIPRHGSAFVRQAPHDPSLRLRVAVPADSRADYQRLYADMVERRPGMYARNEHVWDAVLADEEFDQGGAGALRSMIAEDDGGIRGYALFRVKSAWTDHGLPDGELRLSELYAADPAAYAALWRSVLDRDLVTSVRTYGRPMDDPLLQLLAEPRQVRARLVDDLWARVVDVERALPARAYSSAVDVVIEVTDEYCPWNARRWRLTADTSGAECKPVEQEPDLTLPVAALGAAYLGGGSLVAIGAAGLVREHAPGALASLATAMSWPVKPWAGLVF